MTDPVGNIPHINLFMLRSWLTEHGCHVIIILVRITIEKGNKNTNTGTEVQLVGAFLWVS